MIRINLLPDSKKQAAAAASGSTQLWAGIYLLVAVLWMVGLGVIYYLKDQDLEQVRRANRELDLLAKGLERIEQGSVLFVLNAP